jgi:hypothetical protein
VFATKFYKSLIFDREPIGAAVMLARRECKKKTPTSDLGWASYIYYGDPRVAFRRDS